MDKIKTRETIDRRRRRIVGAAAMSLVALELGMRAPARAAGASFGALKQIRSGALNVGYAEEGPADGTPVVLLHGWPYDIHTYVDVAPILAEKGYRVIVPYLRGYGTTRFLSDETMRNGQQAALAMDAI